MRCWQTLEALHDEYFKWSQPRKKHHPFESRVPAKIIFIGITVDFSRGKLIGVTGVSGSGKSSLVFGVLAAEGHRKYVESLSTKARQVLEKVKRPEVDFVDGLSPVLAIEQASAGIGIVVPVATATEIADYARLLWSTVGKPHCPLDGSPVSRRTLDDCVEQVMSEGLDKRVILLAPFLIAKASVLREELPALERRGFQTRKN